MNVTGVDFICVPTQDFEKSESFYGDVLGLERSKRWGNMPAREFETGSLTLASKLGVGTTATALFPAERVIQPANDAGVVPSIGAAE